MRGNGKGIYEEKSRGDSKEKTQTNYGVRRGLFIRKLEEREKTPGMMESRLGLLTWALRSRSPAEFS